jgi:hypothetical protein
MFSLFQPLSLVAEAVGALPSTSRGTPRLDPNRHPTAEDFARLSIEPRACEPARQG